MQIFNFKDFKTTETEFKKGEIIKEEISSLEYLIYNRNYNKLLSFKDIIKMEESELENFGLQIDRNFSSSTDYISKVRINPFRLIFNIIKVIKYYNHLDFTATEDNIPIMVFSKSILDGKNFGAKNIWHVRYHNTEVVDFLKEKFIEEDSLELNNIIFSNDF
jgi:hypothetical protein